MPNQSWGKSGVLAYFGPKIGHIFGDMDFKFVLPIIFINLLKGKPSSKSIGPKLTTLTAKKSQKWPYIKIPFVQVSITKKPTPPTFFQNQKKPCFAFWAQCYAKYREICWLPWKSRLPRQIANLSFFIINLDLFSFPQSNCMHDSWPNGTISTKRYWFDQIMVLKDSTKRYLFDQTVLNIWPDGTTGDHVIQLLNYNT